MNEGRIQGDNRIAVLDGLRALSITGVLISHALYDYARSHHDLWVTVVTNLGPLGVSVFFGISGFIITTLLLRELSTNGTIDLSAFYLRRAFRILPPYYLYVLFVVVIGSSNGWVILNAITFLTNYRPSNWWLGHTWSLSSEEQFYLLWPALVLFLGPPRACYVALSLIALTPFSRLTHHLLQPSKNLGLMLHTRIDSLMVGCLIALWRDRWTYGPLSFLTSGRLGALSFVFLIAIAPIAGHYLHWSYLIPGPTLEALAVGCVLLWALHNVRGPIVRFLCWHPVQRLGLISYSLYLWQQPFFAKEWQQTPVGRFPFNILAPLGIAALSYQFLEKPLLRTRNKLLEQRTRRATINARAT